MTGPQSQTEAEIRRIGMGGGCHWCTEAVFQSLNGVARVEQGFIRSDPPDEAFSEAVLIHYDPARITLETLIRAHLATHASASDHKLRGKYRSAIYSLDEGQGAQAAAIIKRLRARTGTDFITRILAFRGFRPSDARYHDYYRANPQRPFCRTYIAPKLARLRAVLPGRETSD